MVCRRRKTVEARDRGNQDIVLWGDGSPTREFLYVGDCVEALRLATEKYDGVEAVNLGSGEEIAIRDLAALIAGSPVSTARSSGTSQGPMVSRAAESNVSRAEELSDSARRPGCARDSSGLSTGTAAWPESSMQSCD